MLVTYAMGARTTLPSFLTRGAGQTGIIETVKALKARVEGAGPSTRCLASHNAAPTALAFTPRS